MDDVIGGIVYIVIMLAIFIFSAFRKKKEGSENKPAPEEEGRENPMDEVFQPFKDVFSDEEEDEVAPEKQPAKTTSTGSGSEYSGRTDSHGTPFVKDDYVFTSRTSPGDKRRQRINQKPGQQTSLKSEEDQPEMQQSGGAPDWFDLRKAVIFSEILKRPDY